VFDDAETVVERVNRIAGDIIQEVLPALRSGTLPRYPQDESRASYWAKRTPDDGLINWDLPARDLYNFIRGVTHPFPGAFSYIEGRKVLILKTGVVACALREKAGTVLGPYCSHGKEHQAGIAVAAQGGLLIILGLATEDGAAVDGARLVAFAEKWQGKQFQAFR
jgi:UDP-4-amino-4-deoxy-L-arabinose formyltransferase/UDP-glucuronic acid dehydrogenase (UDP-4-keto-hexauronic acid decarboxylating)